MTAAGTTRDPLAGSRPKALIVASRVVQLVLTAVFAGAGLAKVAGEPAMVTMFADIGAGQWLRPVVDVLELAGALGLLVPRLAGLAALGLAAVMVGASVVNALVLDVTPLLTLLLLAAPGTVAWTRRRETTLWVPSSRRRRPGAQRAVRPDTTGGTG